MSLLPFSLVLKKQLDYVLTSLLLYVPDYDLRVYEV